MFFFVLTLSAMFLYKIQFRKETKDVLSVDDTLIVNGLFVVLIFLSHSTQYIFLTDSIGDILYHKFSGFCNQWVVTTFLAFSGYGCMIKIRHNQSYLNGFLKNRVLKVLISFDIAVLMYLLLATIMGVKYSASTILLSFVGWTSLGNSNWYIFAILVMYLLLYCMAKVWKEKHVYVALTVTLGTVLYIVLMVVVGQPARFYSTIMCFPIGVWLAIYKEKIVEVFIKRKVVSLIALLVLFVPTCMFRYNDYIMNFNSCVLIFLVVWFLSQFKVQNKALRFLGKHAFSIYILQRIPMIILDYKFNWLIKYNIAAVIIVWIITFIMAIVFDKFLSVIYRKVLKIA